MTQQQTLKTGGILTIHQNTLVCSFASPRLVLSTSLYNGGYLKAEAIFNHRLNFFVAKESDLPGGNLQNYLVLTAKKYGLNPQSSTGLLTSAHISCRAYSTLTYKDITVEIIVTAGAEKNAVRAGDPACYYEHDGTYQPLVGTINIMALTNVKLPYGAMAKALLSITEAKTAALQELAITSPFTHNPATGTGTDGIIISCDPESATLCNDTGTQSKMGELLCLAVKTAVKQSLSHECNFNAARQGRLASRLFRLAIKPTELLSVKETAQHKTLLAMTQAVWQEYRWGLLSKEELDYYFTLLNMPAFQPVGADLAALLQRKIETFSENEIKQSSRRPN